MRKRPTTFEISGEMDRTDQCPACAPARVGARKIKRHPLVAVGELPNPEDHFNDSQPNSAQMMIPPLARCRNVKDRDK